MILYVNGCSMTFGDEMGPPHDPICNTRAWPRYLGEMLNASVVNDSWPGGSNDRIMRTTINFIGHFLTEHRADDLRVVIGWTHPIRREFHDADHDKWYNFIPANHTSAGSLTPVYYPTFCSEEEAWGRYLAQLLPMQAFLKQHQIAYAFFTGMFPQPMYHLIDRSRFFLPNDCFSDWTIRNGYPIGPGHHPLDQAHQTWATILYQEMWQ